MPRFQQIWPHNQGESLVHYLPFEDWVLMIWILELDGYKADVFWKSESE